MSYVLRQWQRLGSNAVGRWLFTRMICFRAPYFSSIKPRFEQLAPWQASVFVKKRRAVTNHIGTIHAIAMANACEMAAGVMMEASVPHDMRWIPRGMTIHYQRKASGAIRVKAHAEAVVPGSTGDCIVHCEVRDDNNDIVVQADIAMYVSPKKKG